MRHKSIIIRHRYDVYSGELKAEFTDLYKEMHNVMKIDSKIRAYTADQSSGNSIFHT